MWWYHCWLSLLSSLLSSIPKPLCLSISLLLSHHLNYHFHVETFTWKQTGKLLWSNREGGMARSCLCQISNLHPLVPRLRLILQHLTSKIKANLIIDYHFKVHLLLNYNFITISIDWQCTPSSLFNHHLRSEGKTTIHTPIHPEPASHNRSLSTGQCSW